MCSAWVTVVLCEKSYNIGPRYNGTLMYMAAGMFAGMTSCITYPDINHGKKNGPVLLSHVETETQCTIYWTTFSNAFYGMKFYQFRWFWVRFHRSLFPTVQQYSSIGSDNNQSTSNYLNQWWWIYWHLYASLDLNDSTEKRICGIVSCSMWIFDILKLIYWYNVLPIGIY